VIVIVPPESYSANQHLLREMHRLRYRVFTERLRWTADATSGEERDRFDDLDPVYVIALDDLGKVVGSWRLLPTTGPYMLRDVFSQLLDGQPAPQNSLFWECSRFAVEYTPGQRDGLNMISHVTGEIFCGLVEYCRASGIREIVTVYDVRIARLLPKIGCKPYRRTRTQRVDGVPVLAGFFAIDHSVLEQIRTTNGITASVVRDAPWLRATRAA
jgi:acyl homoserine lactone synthase